MKCPICGNDEFFDTSEDFLEYPGDKIRIQHFACSKCGYTFLVDNKIKEMNFDIVEYNKLLTELAEAERELDGLEKKFGIDKLKERVKALKEERNSLDITIRRQQEIDAEIESINSTPVPGYKEADRELNILINKLKSDIKHFEGSKACYYNKVKI